MITRRVVREENAYLSRRWLGDVQSIVAAIGEVP
jgi:hypothetical protein